MFLISFVNNYMKQAGAELCKAQIKLGLSNLWLCCISSLLSQPTAKIACDTWFLLNIEYKLAEDQRTLI